MHRLDVDLGHLIAVAAVFVVGTAACTSSDTTEIRAVDDRETEFEEQEFDDSATPGATVDVDADAPDAVGHPLGDEIVLGAYRPPDGWVADRWNLLDDVLLDADGVTLTVLFIGGPAREPTDPCARNYGLVVDESAGDGGSDVSVGLVELVAADPDPVPDNYGCTSEGHSWRIDHTLDEPLGDRPLVDTANGRRVPVTDMARVLLPTHVPEGWTLGGPTAFDGTLFHTYERLDGEGSINVASVDIGGSWGLRDIRNRPAVDVEEATVRSLPGIRVVSQEDGAVTLAWEEAGRVYEVHGYRIDESELVAIAESME